MDKGRLVGMILLDLKKAFDTVNHSILVAVSGTFSSEAEIECGVPQGSILGRLLFLIYVNDMSAAVKQKLLLYADDFALLVQRKLERH